MKSRITIEVDFENGNTPVIQILQTNSDDVRDKLIQHFAEQLNGNSWCQIKWVGGALSFDPKENEPFNRIHITPIPASKFKEQAEIMLQQVKINEQNNNIIHTN